MPNRLIWTTAILKIIIRAFPLVVTSMFLLNLDISANSPQTSPLVVQIASFKGTVINYYDVRLDWMTISETNNYGFYVQRKKSNDVVFQTLPNSFVEGYGTTTEQHYYSWVDSGLPDGIYQYRLKQIDLNGEEHVSFTIEIIVANHRYTISATSGANGTIAPSGSVSVIFNGVQRFTFTSNTGFHVDSVIVDGSNVPDSTAGYTFRNVAADHTIRAVFRINQFTIIATSGTKGTIFPTGSVSVNFNGSQQFTFTPDTGYHVDSVIVDGSNVPDSTTSYTFKNVTSNHTICVIFRVNQSITVMSRWNMISIPLSVQNSQRTVLFPTATSQCWGYAGGYISYTTLQNGKGYWLKFPQADTVVINGIPIESDTVNVAAGWNMIGSISEPIAVGSIASNIQGMITSSIYGYAGSYYSTDTIYPGKGYWVKVNQTGSLILSTSSLMAKSSSSRIRIVPTSELPPPPPDYITNEQSALPKEYALDNAYPSPFNPTATIRYQLPEDSRVTLKVYNLLGEVVSTLSDAQEEAGYKSIEWNAGNNASGVYFYRLEAISTSDPSRSFTQVKKMVLLK